LENKKIILVGANELVCLQLLRLLARSGNEVSTLRFSVQHDICDHSRYCKHNFFIGSLDIGVKTFQNKLRDLLVIHHFNYLIPVCEVSTELIYSAYESLSKLTVIVGPEPTIYSRVKNRHQALLLAQAAGFVVPESVLMTQDRILSAHFYPCQVVPNFACTIIADEIQQFSTRTVNSPDELDAKFRDDLFRNEVMLQKPTAGNNLELNVYAAYGNVLAVSAISKLHTMANKDVCSYRKTEEVTSEMLSLLQNIAQELHYSGFLTVECRTAHQQLIFLSMNPWLSNSCLLSHCNGTEFAKLFLSNRRDSISPQILRPEKERYSRHLVMDLIWLFSNLIRSNRFNTLFLWIKSWMPFLKGIEIFEVEEFDDMCPTFRQFDMYIRILVKKIKLCIPVYFLNLKIPQKSRNSINSQSSFLFVCKGNINRSLVAEQLLKAQGFKFVHSAGLLEVSGRKPSQAAEAFLAERVHSDLSGLRSKSLSKLTKQNINFDMVLCFERIHIVQITEKYPVFQGKVFLLSKLVNDNDKQPEISDPHNEAPNIYNDCFLKIESMIIKMAELIS
jgi:protein-tyrosine-phosphatase